MNFDRNDEQRAIAETARELLAARGPEADVWPELCELGWPGIAVDERHGGGGLGLTELAILLEEHGYACAATPLLGTTLAALAIESCGSEEQRGELSPALAAGRLTGALARSDHEDLVPDAGADVLLVAASAASGEGFLHRSGGATDCEAIDPRRRHGRLAAGAAGEALPGDARAALDRAAIVVAAELVGLCRRALDLTVAYVKERTQFGVPIGSFQAVQHGAAQMLRETESASVLVQNAAWMADHEPERAWEAAAMAKASAAAAGRAVTAAAIQLHGGIGFTWEADLHWLFKRAQVDAVYLGSAGAGRVDLARALAGRSPAVA
jgi:alkylation response protein AidB-like acyl-CoA dehydrogenase